MTVGATWSTPYKHYYLVNIVYRFVLTEDLKRNSDFRKLGTDGRQQTDDGQRAMTKAHLAF